MIGVLFAVVILNPSIRHRHSAPATQFQIIRILQNQVGSLSKWISSCLLWQERKSFRTVPWIRQRLQSKTSCILRGTSSVCGAHSLHFPFFLWDSLTWWWFYCFLTLCQQDGNQLLRGQLLNCLQVRAPAIAVFVVYTGNCRGGKWAQPVVMHLSRKRYYALSLHRVVLTHGFISYVFCSYRAADFAGDFLEIFRIIFIAMSFGQVVVEELPPALFERFQNHFRDLQ